jgi:hypothetical protein
MSKTIQAPQVPKTAGVRPSNIVGPATKGADDYLMGHDQHGKSKAVSSTGRWLCHLTDMPSHEVEAKDEAEAVRKYMAWGGINSTDHTIRVEPVAREVAA